MLRKITTLLAVSILFVITSCAIPPLVVGGAAGAAAGAGMGARSERRTGRLVDNRRGGRPAFLTAEPGLNAGFMIAQVTAAALVSENKGLAWPASVDSLPTSANQEDHVSMAAYAARRLTTMGRNAAGIVAIELLAAAQGLDFHRPMESTPTLMACHGRVRAIADRLAEDRPLAADIAGVQAAIADRGLLAPVVRALLRRPVREGFDVKVALDGLGGGRYAADVAVPLPGQWEVRVLARRGADSVHDRARVTLP